MRIIAGFLLFWALNLQGETFDVWMGSETKHWAHVTQDKDQTDLAQFRSLFEKNGPLVEQVGEQVKIPKIVHFIWIGPRPFPPESVENVRTWIAKNPDWTFKFWTDRQRDPPCRGMETIVIKEYPFPLLSRCYEASKNWGEKSDILRFEILLEEGGVYADHDANCLVPFEPYNRAYNFFCGLETPHPPFVGRNITAGNGVLGASPNHPVIKKVIELIDERWEPLETKFVKDRTLPKEQLVMERTYIALTDALPLSLERPGFIDIVFPASHFFSKKGLKPILSKHFFANSWAGEDPGVVEKNSQITRKHVNKIETRLHQLTLFLIAAFIINLLLLGFGLFFLRKARLR
jgi:hypothetical protein